MPLFDSVYFILYQLNNKTGIITEIPFHTTFVYDMQQRISSLKPFEMPIWFMYQLIED